MTQCASSVPLTGSAASVGLFEDVGTLSFGSAKLRLAGVYRCLDVGLPFYKFDIMKGDKAIGEITFMPEKDLSKIASLGHSGGELTEGSRGHGIFGNALQALAPLAGRHGLAQLMVVIPKNNAAAMKGAEKLKLILGESDDQHARFMLTV